MEYNIERTACLPAEQAETSVMICPHCHGRFETVARPPRKAKNKGLWVEATTVVQKTNAFVLAERAVALTQRPRLASYPGAKRGPKPTYREVTVLLTFLVAKLWHLSYEEMLAWLAHWPALALALGYPLDEDLGQPRIISLGSYSKRLRALGLAPFFCFFVLLVQQLVQVGLIQGRDLILDSTLVRAWSRSDPWCAFSYKYKDINKRFGFKVHTVLDRCSGLPVMLCLSPANAHDSPFALPLLQATKRLYDFAIEMVRADAAYHSRALFTFVTQTLGAFWAVDYNLRRRGKRALAHPRLMRAWRWLMRPRSLIERFFAWTKRYFALKYFQVQGQEAITRHVLATYSATLWVAWIAVLFQRPDLTHSPSRVLAFFDA